MGRTALLVGVVAGRTALLVVGVVAGRTALFVRQRAMLVAKSAVACVADDAVWVVGT